MKPQRPAILAPLKFPYKLYNLPHITVMLDMNIKHRPAHATYK